MHTRHRRLFLGLCKDIKVAIDGFKIRHLIFVIEIRDYNLDLEQPFLNAVKFSQDYKLNSVFRSITHFETQELAILHRKSHLSPGFKLDTRRLQSLCLPRSALVSSTWI